MYHIGDLKKFVRCPRYYFLSCDSEGINNQYLRSDESIIELLKRHLHVDKYFQGQRGDANDAFFENENDYEWFVKTRFEHNGLRIKIPIMHKCKDGYDLYFVYKGVQIKELDIFYYQLNIEVLRNIGIEIDDAYIAYVNKDYVFYKSLDTDSLFMITDHFKGKRLIDIFDSEINDYKSIIRRIESTDLKTYIPKKTRLCHGRSICPYYFDCFKEEKDLPDDTILSLVSSQHKDLMYRKGIKHLKDADLDLVEGNRVQYAQIRASQNNGLFVDKYNVKNFLKKFDNYPISFVDFEWDTYLIPQYDGMKPLDVIPFEFVLYILNEDGQMNNYSFVGSGDCRKEFLEALLDKLPNSGPIVAYNALGAEARRLEELGALYPEYSKKIEEINKRFIDLAYPFSEGLVYDTRMMGNFTMKKLVNIISGLDYKDLQISDGMDAVYSWRDIDKNINDENNEEKIDKLIEYCGLDAYGLYLIYKWLKELVI